MVGNPGDTPARPTSIRTARIGQRARDFVIQPFGSEMSSMPIGSRHRFLTNAAFTGAAGLAGLTALLAAEPPPEI
jgi:hypothetical protein